MRISEILNQQEIDLIKYACALFSAQFVEIDGVRYQPPKSNNKGEKP